jgi:hypothetical protein
MRIFPAVWLAVFFFLAFTGSVLAPPGAALAVLGALGIAYCVAYMREALTALVRGHLLLVASAAALALAILWSQSWAAWRGMPMSDTVPAQTALFLCLPVLGLFLRDVRLFQAAVGLFGALTLWHFVMLPVEGLTGFKWTWHPVHPLPREIGPLKFQASGLAIQTYCFIGLYLPLFYLAWGPVAARRVPGWQQPSWLMAALPLLWVIPIAAVQSRSGLAGAVAAGGLAFLTWNRRPRWRDWLILAAGIVVVALVYWQLFAQGKTGPGLRMAYVKAYFLEGLDLHWLATGRGFSLLVPPPVAVEGFMPLTHSHNDVAQVFYSWGPGGLVAYGVFWFALLRLVFTRFVARAEYWPGLALVALAPSLITDLGIHFYEKAVFLVIVAAMCMACSQVGRAGRETGQPRAGKGRGLPESSIAT